MIPKLLAQILHCSRYKTYGNLGRRDVHEYTYKYTFPRRYVTLRREGSVLSCGLLFFLYKSFGLCYVLFKDLNRRALPWDKLGTGNRYLT